MHSRLLKNSNPRVYNIVRSLVRNADLPMPKIYLIPEMQPNAFATGRNPEHAAVAVTAGLLETMDDAELSGVIGHELGHVKHRDILISTIAAIFAGAISIMSRFAMYSLAEEDVLTMTGEQTRLHFFLFYLLRLQL